MSSSGKRWPNIAVNRTRGRAAALNGRIVAMFAGLSSDLWRISQVNLALLLPQTEWDFLSKHYALLPHLQHEVGRVNTMHQDEIAGLRRSLDQQVTEMKIFRDIVGELETRGRSKLFM